ncbi:cupredoxin domain-containing protein [Streptomyces mirabilis]|uniref:hypothetical protein n=1 Tax=Streptomyces mirabilis TaxID=68239 RepID=UPI0036A836E9
MSTGIGGMCGSPSSSPSDGGITMKFTPMGAESPLLGGDAGDVKYPYHLVNGRVPADPLVFRSKPGKRVRIPLINTGGDSAYRVSLGGHRLTITHTDGFPRTGKPRRADQPVTDRGEFLVMRGSYGRQGDVSGAARRVSAEVLG